MAITFHCEYCGRKIEAPDTAGGKWGKCPSCHNKLYVPNLTSNEELKVAPVDNSDEARRKQLMAETYEVTQEILEERESPNDTAEAAEPVSGMSDKELTEKIISYLRQMADGKLDQADMILDSIVHYSSRAVRILDGIALSQIPEPELADIPPQVLSGLIRTLRAKIS